MNPIDGCNPEIYGHLCFVPDRPDRLGTRCTTDGYPYTTSYDTCPPPISATETVAVTAQPKQIHRLPETGLDGSLAPIGLVLVVVGALLVAFTLTWGALNELNRTYPPVIELQQVTP